MLRRALSRLSLTSRARLGGGCSQGAGDDDDEEEEEEDEGGEEEGGSQGSSGVHKSTPSGLRTSAKKAKSSSPKSKASLPPPAPPPSIPTASAAWMDKPGVNWDKDACDLFGRRISMKHPRTKQMEKAVIKGWNPCDDQFSVVFDSMPGNVYSEDLLRKGRQGRDWQLDTWEGDVWETAELRPVCPRCGHPLGEGRAAWTRCMHCQCGEAGATATATLGRPTQGGRPRVDYKDADSDSD